MEDSYGWENFLLPSASGAQLGHEQTDPASAFQVLPGVGMRICSDFSREENDIIHYVYESAAASGSTALRSLPLDLKRGSRYIPYENRKTLWPHVRLRYHTQSVVLSPSPFREDLALRLDVRSTVPSSLSAFSPMLYRIEQQGPGPNAPAAALNAPNVFPVMAIRSWHRPLRRWDLHYHKDPIDECTCKQKPHSNLQ
ncbi:hypothetical protein OHC33_008531 [Knufia fluminis]|uniref:Uncharacterized protein n=1 Tax=Knufia fluminis TaxID=191047 RepID=A0AAN8I1Z3_9EURO|nr:hypothetical protein OHC33_008531 [Knufia fluminis]